MDAPVVYSVDASDAIVHVNEAWRSFAAANDGSALLPPAILGRTLWEFITDDVTLQLYRRLLARVRGGSGPVQFAFRCDSPGMRRLLEMNILADIGGGVTFVVHPLVLEQRDRVELLDPHALRAGRLLRLCGWCKRIPDADGRWMEVEEALPTLEVFAGARVPAITHGICGDCEKVMMKALDSLVLGAAGPIVLGGPTTALRPQ